MYYLLLLVFGLIIGSFIGAFSYRYPRELSVLKGRSICPNCKEKISLFDNIPLLSYLFLRGKCRSCGNKIALRYPLIEFSTAVVFILVALSLQGPSPQGLPTGALALPYLLVIAGIIISVFVIDFENQIIPDELVFFAFALTGFLLLDNNQLYAHLLSGFLAALCLLALHLITLGRGMGLGDVKLALFGGVFFGVRLTITWLFLSFIIGALVGLILIAVGKAKFGKHIAFGPFMVISFFITLFWGKSLLL